MLPLLREPIVDLNYLLGRHQRSLISASTAASPEARHSHRGLVSGYADRIRNLQVTLGATAYLSEAN